MLERLRNGYQIARQCWQVLKLDKELLAFPALSSLALLSVSFSFAMPLWETDYVQMYVDCIQNNDDAAAEKYSQNIRDPLFYLLLFCFYLSQYFVITFFNTALVACALVRLNGGDPNVAVGLRFARSRLKIILAWAAFSAAVGVILRFFESRSRTAGKMATGLLGMGWSIGSYLVVPILVAEKLGPVDAFKRSVAIIANTWGEALGANIGIGAVSCLCVLVACIPGAIGYSMNTAFAMALGIGISVVLVIAINLVAATLQSILLAALYQYADDGKRSPHFDEQTLANAFLPQ